jgi:peroxiredoxin
MITRRKFWRPCDRLTAFRTWIDCSANKRKKRNHENNTIMALSVGSKAPDFTLKSKQASGLVDVKLSNNFGKKNTVLLFFPAAFTGVCTQEMCDVSAGLNGYSSLNADVIAISVDTPFSQEAWAHKEKINLTLASDLNKEVTKKFDVLFPMLAGIGDTSARAAFVIDKAGVVQYSEQTPTPKDLPNFNKVKETLGKLK